MFEVTFKGQNEFDQIFTIFSKFVLVHTKASHFAVFSELCQLSFSIAYCAIHNNNSIVNKAYRSSVIMRTVSDFLK